MPTGRIKAPRCNRRDPVIASAPYGQFGGWWTNRRRQPMLQAAISVASRRASFETRASGAPQDDGKPVLTTRKFVILRRLRGSRLEGRTQVARLRHPPRDKKICCDP